MKYFTYLVQLVIGLIKKSHYKIQRVLLERYLTSKIMIQGGTTRSYKHRFAKGIIVIRDKITAFVFVLPEGDPCAPWVHDEVGHLDHESVFVKVVSTKEEIDQVVMELVC